MGWLVSLDTVVPRYGKTFYWSQCSPSLRKAISNVSSSQGNPGSAGPPGSKGDNVSLV